MTIHQKVQALLIADAALVALVPASKIKVEGDWQGLTLPYIIHGHVAMEPTNTHGGQTPLRTWTYQVSIYADAVSSASVISQAVIAALNGHHDSEVDRCYLKQALAFGFDTDLKVANEAVDFEIAGILT